MDNFTIEKYDLSKARDDKEIYLDGNYYKSFFVLDIDGTAEMGFTRSGDRLVLGTEINKMTGLASFDSVYLTNQAQPGKELKIIFGQNLGSDTLEAFSQLSQFGVDVNSTPGLKAGELNLDGSKNLGVNIISGLTNLFKTTDFTEIRDIRSLPKVGSEGNVWSNELTGVNTSGSVVDITEVSNISIFGEVDGACAISILVSQNGSDFYQADTAEFNPSAAGQFHFEKVIAAKYITLQSDTDVTATCTIAGKV